MSAPMAIVVVGADCMYKRCYLEMLGDMAQPRKKHEKFVVL